MLWSDLLIFGFWPGLGLPRPKAIVIVYQPFRPYHAFTEITKKKRGKVRTTACEAYQCASKKARGNKNIFSDEHDSWLQVLKKHRKISDTNRTKRFD